MNYLSTRGDATPRKFCEILLEGLAPDGGLYLPANYPQINDIALQKLRDIHTKHGYADLAFAILSLYIDDIPAADLQALCRKTYTQEVYGTKDIVPLKELDDKVYLEALSNGPTPARSNWRAGPVFRRGPLPSFAIRIHCLVERWTTKW